MRISLGQLRRIIKEEVSRVKGTRSRRLRESMSDPGRASDFGPEESKWDTFKSPKSGGVWSVVKDVLGWVTDIIEDRSLSAAEKESELREHLLSYDEVEPGWLDNVASSCENAEACSNLQDFIDGNGDLKDVHNWVSAMEDEMRGDSDSHYNSRAGSWSPV